MDDIAHLKSGLRTLTGAMLLFGALIVVAQPFQWLQLRYWPIVAALVGTFVVIAARRDLSLPLMSRRGSLIWLVILAVMMANFAVVWDRELTVRQIVSLARTHPDQAYVRWKRADARTASALESKHPEVVDILERAEEARRTADAGQMRKHKAAANAARAAEQKRRREQFAKNPLRGLAPYLMAAFAWLLVHGDGKA